MDGVNEADENGKILNLLNPDVEKQTFGRKSQNWPNLWDENGILLKKNISMKYTFPFSSCSSCVFITITIGGQMISRSSNSLSSPFHRPYASPDGTITTPLLHNSSSKSSEKSLCSFGLRVPLVFTCVRNDFMPRYQQIEPGPFLHAGQCHCLAGSLIWLAVKSSNVPKNSANHGFFLRESWLF
ncbi:hypothetical protein Hanom_Chr03g00183951 [Helianthus anomalus]